MAAINYQYELIKLYLAAFVRAPEKSGLEYWLAQIESGRSFDAILETVFSLDIVKAIYPSNMTSQAFVTAIYANVFGKVPDTEGLSYWVGQLNSGLGRGKLVMDMINAGLSTPDGTPGKAYIVNRLAVSQYAVDLQTAQQTEYTPAFLKSVLQTVNADTSTVTSAQNALDPSVTGIGIGAPSNALTVPAAANGLSLAEIKAGVRVTIDLKGTNAVAGHIVELLIDKLTFPDPVRYVLTAADIKAQVASFTTPVNTVWGSDGTHTLSAFVRNTAGVKGNAGGEIAIVVNQIAPNAPLEPVEIVAATNGINSLERAAGVQVKVSLLGTGALAGDSVEILLDGKSFSPTATKVLTAADLDAGFVLATVPANAAWGSDGEKIIAARVIDIAGNIGSTGGGLAVQLDQTAPGAYKNPLVIDVAIGGLSAAERASDVLVTVNLSGMNLVVGDAIEILIDGKPFTNSTLHRLSAEELAAKVAKVKIVGGDSAWGTTDGIKTVTARVVDAAGNLGAAGGDLRVTVDTLAPASQNATITIAAAANGLSAAELAAGVDVVVNLNATNAVAGDVVVLLMDGQPIGNGLSATLTAAQVSAKTLTLKIPNGAHWGTDGPKTISAFIRDSAGNVGPNSNDFAVSVDTQAPGKASLAPIIAAASANINSLEKTAGVQVKVDLTDTNALVGDKVEVLLNGASMSTPVYQTVQVADLLNGFVLATIPSTAGWGADGSKIFAARVIDIAGNVGATSDSVTVVLDTVAPSGPTAVLQVAANSGGGLTPAERSAGVVVVADLTGTSAIAGEQIEILIGGQSFANPVIKTLTAAEIAAKSVSVTIGTNDGWGSSGSKDLTARFIDTSGNPGTATGKISVLVLSPNAISNPLQMPVAVGGINPSEKANVIVVTANLAGTNVQAGDAFELLIDGKPFANSTLHIISASEIAAGSASTSIAASDAAWGSTDGDRTIAARIIDTTGKVGVSGGSLKVTLDSVTPLSEKLTLTIPAALNGLNAAELAAGVNVTVNLTGTNAVAGDLVTFLLGDTNPTILASATITAAQASAKSAVLTIPGTAIWGADGSKTISAYITDTAGNQGLAGGALNVLVDTSVPTMPSNPIQIPAAVDAINLVEKQNGVAVVVDLRGTNAASGDKVEVLIDGVSFSTAIFKALTTSDIANQSVTVEIPSTANWGADGIKLMSARVVDTTGNLGAASVATAVETDFTAPLAFKGSIQIDAAIGGLSAAEKAVDVMATVNLSGQNVVLGDSIELLIDGKPFAVSTVHAVTASEVASKLAQVKIKAGDSGWGATDGNRVITARVIDAAGNVGIAGGDLKVTVDSQAPSSQNASITIAAAANGLSAAEIAAGIDVVINLTGTSAVAGDSVVLLLDGQAIGSGLSTTLSAAQASAKTLSIKIPNGSHWAGDGSKTISAYIRDSAGNVGANSNNFNVTVDTQAPTKPSVLPVIAAATSNINASEKNAGVQVKVDLAGTGALVGDKVEVLLNGSSMTTPVYQTIQVADLLNGFVIATIPSTAGWGADGSKIFAVRVIDIAGNIGATSDSVTVVLDTVAPSGPTAVLQVAANSGGGLTPAERSAGVVVVVDLTGTSAIAGEQIEILIAGQSFATPVIKTLTVAEVAAKSVSLTIGTNDGWISTGSKDLSARFIDTSGNPGTATGKISVNVLAPTAITSPLQIPVAVGGINPTEKANTIVVTVNLAGTNVQAGDAIELLIDNKTFTNSTLHVISASEIAAGTANLTIAGGDPSWGAVDGDRTISARIIDTFGKAGASGGSLKVSLDSVGPLSEKITLTVPAALNGLNAAELAAGVSVTVNLTGTNAVAGDIVTLLLGTTTPVPIVSLTLSAAQVTAKSAVIVIPGTVDWGGDGNKTLSAYITDTAGNQGLTGGALNLVVDSLVPSSPTNPIQIPAATNAINLSEKQAGVAVLVDLTGTNAAVGDKLEILLGGASFSTPVQQVLSATDITNMSATVIIPNTAVWGSDGIKLLSARVVDVTGNLGPASVATAAEIDFTAPAAFKGTIQIDAAIGGLSAAEKAAEVLVTVNLTGQSVALGDSIELLIDGRPFTNSTVHLVTADELTTKLAQLRVTAGDSAWGSTDGFKVITARVIDAAGNIGVAGGDLRITVDSQAPASQNATITIAAAANGLNATELAAGVDVSINLTGTNALAGDVVVVLLDGQAIGTGLSTILTAAQVSAKTLSLRIPNGAHWGTDGTKTVSAYIRDSAGNIGANSNDLSVLLDTQAPTKPSVLPVIAAAVSNINANEKTAGVQVKVDLTDTGALVGDKVEIVLNGTSMSTPVYQTIQVQDLLNGFVTATIPSAAGWGADGSKVFAARVIDVAGNLGVLSDSVTVVLDTVAPSGPTVALQVAANSGGGLTPAERAAGVVVVADLTGTSAIAGEQIEILIGGVSFATPVIKTLTAAEVVAKSVSLTIGTNDGWGSSGSKDLTARFIDGSGNAGSASGKVSVIVLSPNPIASPLQIPVAIGGINPTEKANAMVVTASLAGTNVQAGDAIELLIDGRVFANSTLHVITAAEVTAGSANLTITGGDSAWGVTDGDRTIAARIIDMNGKVGVSGGSLKVTLDSIAPLSQNLVLTAPVALNGLNAAEIAAGVDVTVNLTGTNAVAGDVVTLLIGGVSFSPAVNLTLSAAQITAKSAVVTIPGTANWGADGNKTLSAYITDTAGNQGLAGGALNVVVDALVPSAPTNPILIPASTNSINSSEKQSGVTVLVDLTGTNAASGDRIEVLLGGSSFSSPVLQSITSTDIINNLVNVVIPSTANWGSDGIKLVSVRVVDVTGNLGPASAAVSVNLDTSAPSGPTSLLQVPANSGGGIGPAERAAGVVVTVDLTGTTATVGETIEVLIGGASFATPVSKILNLTDLVNRSVSLTINTGDGWGVDGNKILSARFIDASGNLGSAAGAVTVTLDGTPPSATPSALVVAAAANGLSGVEKNAGVDVVIDLTSTGVIAGDTVSILLDGLPFSVPVTQTISAAQVLAKSAQVTIPGTAVWGADGNKTLSAVFTDALGNVGAVGGSVTISLDTTAPGSPSNSVSIAAASNGINAAEKSAGVSVVVDLTGTGAVVGDRAEILIGGVSFPTAVIQNIGASEVSNGSLTLTIPSSAVWGSDGSKIISARILDFAGNPGALGGAISVNLDTTAPNPTGIALSVPAASGGIDNAEKAAGVNVQVDLTGTGVVAGDQVEILVGGTSFTVPVLHTVTAGEVAAKLATATILQSSGWGNDNDKVFTARFIDIAGNVSAAGGSLTVTMQDTTPPNAPVTQLYVPVSGGGISLAEKNAGVTVTGYLAGTFAAAGDTATLLIDGSGFTNAVTHVLTAGEISAGNFDFSIPSNAGWGSDGSHILSMRLTDVAGNVGNVGGAVTVSLDTVAPTAPTNPLVVAVASNGINAVEKTAGVVATVDLAGTGAVLNDRVEILLGGSSFTIPVLYSINASDLSSGFVNVTIPANAGWGSDGVKTLSSRVIDVAGNIGAIGGSLTTLMETSIPAAAGLPTFTDVDTNGLINNGDTYVFYISEATNKAVGLANLQITNSHSFGTGASVSWSSDGTQMTLTLGTGTTVAVGDIITLLGVSDAAGNSNSLSFTI